MYLWFHKLGSPPHFYRIAGKWMPWLGWIFLLLLAAGLYGGLVEAPPDYQQGESYRIIFVHVPAAWMSLFVYVVMAVCGAIIIVWHMKLAEVVLISSAPIGASFTLLALVTGSLWGKPMWGTYWVYTWVSSDCITPSTTSAPRRARLAYSRSSASLIFRLFTTRWNGGIRCTRARP